MLYLLTPTGLRWNNILAEVTLNAAREHGADLARLDWQPAEDTTVADVLPVALRYGVACSTGIVIDGSDAVVPHRPKHLQETHVAAAASHAEIEATADAIDQMLGAEGTSRDLTRRINEQHEENLRKAREDAQAQLDARDIDPALLEHWQPIGGMPPST